MPPQLVPSHESEKVKELSRVDCPVKSLPTAAAECNCVLNLILILMCTKCVRSLITHPFLGFRQMQGCRIRNLIMELSIDQSLQEDKFVSLCLSMRTSLERLTVVFCLAALTQSPSPTSNKTYISSSLGWPTNDNANSKHTIVKQ